jgi:hypothetical protein
MDVWRSLQDKTIAAKQIQHTDYREMQQTALIVAQEARGKPLALN